MFFQIDCFCENERENGDWGRWKWGTTLLLLSLVDGNSSRELHGPPSPPVPLVSEATCVIPKAGGCRNDVLGIQRLPFRGYGGYVGSLHYCTAGREPMRSNFPISSPSKANGGGGLLPVLLHDILNLAGNIGGFGGEGSGRSAPPPTEYQRL